MKTSRKLKKGDYVTVPRKHYWGTILKIDGPYVLIKTDFFHSTTNDWIEVTSWNEDSVQPVIPTIEEHEYYTAITEYSP